MDAEPKQVPPVAQQERVEIRRVASQAIAQEHIDKLLNEQADKIARGFQEQIQAFQTQFQALQDKFSQQSQPASMPKRQKPPVPPKNWEQLLETFESNNPFDDDDREYFEEIMEEDYKQPPKPNKVLREFAVYRQAKAKAEKLKHNREVDDLAEQFARIKIKDNYNSTDTSNLIDGDVI